MKRQHIGRALALATAGFLSTSILAAAPALAQRGKKTPEQEAQEKKEKEAYDLYQEGITHYNLGEFDQAIEKFKKAYALTAAPGLLFNIAQAYRLKKDYEQSLYFYKTYLRLDPQAPNRADVEARIAELEKLIEEQKKLGTAKPVGTIPPGGGGTGEPPGGGGGTPPGGGGTGTPPGGGTGTPPGGGGTGTPPGGGGTGTPPGGGGTVAGGGNGSSSPAGGGSAVGGGGDTGIVGAVEPKSGGLGIALRADVDTVDFAGAAFMAGVTYGVGPSLELGAGALVTGNFGLAAGATMFFGKGKLKPLAALEIPVFFDDAGTAVGAHASAGIRYDLAPSFGVRLDLGVAYYFVVPENLEAFYFVPSLGVAGRL